MRRTSSCEDLIKLETCDVILNFCWPDLVVATSSVGYFLVYINNFNSNTNANPITEIVTVETGGNNKESDS